MEALVWPGPGQGVGPGPGPGQTLRDLYRRKDSRALAVLQAWLICLDPSLSDWGRGSIGVGLLRCRQWKDW